jgi:hypothetical protein
MASRGDNELILLLLLLTGFSEEDPELAERFYQKLRFRLRHTEGWDPEIDMIFRRALLYPIRYELEIKEMLSHILNTRLKELEEFRPEVDMLIERAIHYRFKPFPRFEAQARETALSVVDGFRKSFGDQVVQRIAKAEERLEHLTSQHGELLETLKGQKQNVRDLGDEIHDYHWLASVRANMGKVSMQRFLPVRLFLGDPIPEEHDLDLLVWSIQRLCESFGFVVAEEFPPESGSWWKRFVMKTKEVLTHKEVTGRLKKAEKAVEATYLDKPQAEANHHQADAAASVISSLQNTANACVQVGTLLVIKATDENGQSGIFATTLSAIDIQRLESDRSILRQPHKVLQWLRPDNGKGLNA